MLMLTAKERIAVADELIRDRFVECSRTPTCLVCWERPENRPALRSVESLQRIYI